MRGRRNGLRKSVTRARTGSCPPWLEALEERQLLATFMVTNTSDSGTGSLRDAINRANTAAGADIIEFNIPGAGVQTLIPTSPLPTIMDSLTINGRSQPGFQDRPLIEISGVNAGTSANGLRLSSPTTVLGLTINRFAQSGIRMDAGSNIIESSFIGTDNSGLFEAGNGGSGILVNGTSNNVIGSTVAGRGNLISGNKSHGIEITGSSAAKNTVLGNIIGLDRAGSQDLGNTGSGIFILGGGFNQIGGPDPAQRNLISGNDSPFAGIFIQGFSARSNTIQNNYIGTNMTGSVAVGNTGAGVMLLGASRNLIGGTAEGVGNIISGNQNQGINLQGSDQTTIQGNTIGTDPTGAIDLGNEGAGVNVFGSSNNRIGGSLAGAGNVIAFNGGMSSIGGVTVSADFSLGNSILSNSIYQNDGLGIDLIGPGEFSNTVTPNDTLDPDSGPNGLQNYPILSIATTGAGRTLAQGA